MRLGEALLPVIVAPLAGLVACPAVAVHAWLRVRRERRWATEVAEDLIVLLQKGWLDRARSRLLESPGTLGEHLLRIGLWPGKADYYASVETNAEIQRAVSASLAFHERLQQIGVAVGLAGILALMVAVTSDGSVFAGIGMAVVVLLFSPGILLALSPLFAWFCLRRIRSWSADLCLHLRRLQQDVAACLPRAPDLSSPSAPAEDGPPATR